MAGIYAPTVLNFPQPVVEIQSLDSTDYEVLKSSLSSTAYVAEKVHLNASSSTQLNQVIHFQTYDANGEVKMFSVKPSVDPYQKQTSIILDLKKQPIIFDGKLKFDVELLPTSHQQFDFESAQIAPDAIESIPTEDGGFEYKPLAEEERKKIKLQGYDEDFLNRSGFFSSMSSKIPNGTEVTLDNLFDDWCEEL